MERLVVTRKGILHIVPEELPGAIGRCDHAWERACKSEIMLQCVHGKKEMAMQANDGRLH